MNLPSYSELEELNRILLAVSELAAEDGTCSIRTVFELCASISIGSRIFDRMKLINMCKKVGLVSGKGKRINLTGMGAEFLALNTDHSYELTPQQRQFVANAFLFDGPWESAARDLLQNFSPNHMLLTYEFAFQDNPLPVRFNGTRHLLERLDVLQVDGNLLRVASGYVIPVRNLLAGSYGLSENDLALALQANQKLGTQAEEAVVEYERRRLAELGHAPEALLVRRISDLDTARGYDIESYNGSRTVLEYDRFIEVKASRGSDLRFYWTANEKSVAEKLGDAYWIYFIGDYKGGETRAITPFMIQNPAKRLWELPDIIVEPSMYFVRRR